MNDPARAFLDSVSEPIPALPECEACLDTGNAAHTGWRHPGFDELGCPLCNEPGGERCCVAAPWGPSGDTKCANCGHPVEALA